MIDSGFCGHRRRGQRLRSTVDASSRQPTYPGSSGLKPTDGVYALRPPRVIQYFRTNYAKRLAAL